MAAAAYRVEEEEIWECPKHRSQRRDGVCATCLRERLVSLCPKCGGIRPCPCVSSSSSSSAFGGDPNFRRSGSLAIPFLRSRTGRSNTLSFLSVFRPSKAKKNESNDDEKFESNDRIEDFARMITRSRSVGVGTAAVASGCRSGDVSSSSTTGKFWRRMRAFGGSKTPAFVVQDRSPLRRG